MVFIGCPCRARWRSFQRLHARLTRERDRKGCPMLHESQSHPYGVSVHATSPRWSRWWPSGPASRRAGTDSRAARRPMPDSIIPDAMLAGFPPPRHDARQPSPSRWTCAALPAMADWTADCAPAIEPCRPASRGASAMAVAARHDVGRERDPRLVVAEGRAKPRDGGIHRLGGDHPPKARRPATASPASDSRKPMAAPAMACASSYTTPRRRSSRGSRKAGGTSA